MTVERVPVAGFPAPVDGADDGADDAPADRRYLLLAPSGVTALVSTWGATLVSLTAPDRDGRFADVVLGFDDAADYRSHADRYFGCTVGRVAQRIRRAEFRMDGVRYPLAANNGRNALHGGERRSFDRVPWAAEPSIGARGPQVAFTYSSPPMEEGYPGRLDARVTYTLAPDDRLVIDLEATSDARTPVNLTNHTYFNLAGAGAGTIVDHELQVAAGRFTPTDDELIPLGTISSVDGTPLDFRSPTAIGARIRAVEGTAMLGYDLSYVLDDVQDSPAARLQHPASGRVLEVVTDQPCLQFYSGNFLTPTRGKLGATYGHRSGLCLEPQGFPDAVNNPAFPPQWLDPGVVYRRTIEFRLGIDTPRTRGA